MRLITDLMKPLLYIVLFLSLCVGCSRTSHHESFRRIFEQLPFRELQSPDAHYFYLALSAYSRSQLIIYLEF